MALITPSLAGRHLPKAASTFTPMGLSFSHVESSKCRECFTLARRNKQGAAPYFQAYTCDTTGVLKPLGELEVEVIVLVWDAAEAEGAGKILPDGYTEKIFPSGVTSDYANAGYASYGGKGLVIIHMDDMQPQFYIERFVDLFQEVLVHMFPKVTHVVGSGTCATFGTCGTYRCQVGSIALGLGWQNGFSQHLAASSDFKKKVGKAVKAHYHCPLLPRDTYCDDVTFRSVEIQDYVSASETTYPGAPVGTVTCVTNHVTPASLGACFDQNETSLECNNGVGDECSVGDALAALGLKSGVEPTAEGLAFLETDDYYVKAATDVFFGTGVHTFSCRGVINDANPKNDAPTYAKECFAQAAILTALRVITSIA